MSNGLQRFVMVQEKIRLAFYLNWLRAKYVEEEEKLMDPMTKCIFAQAVCTIAFSTYLHRV